MQTTHDNTTIGLDLAKNVFYYTELNRNMRVVRQAKLRRSQVLEHFSRLESSKVRCVAMEACGAGQVGYAAGSDDAAWSSPAGAEDAYAVLQLDPRPPVGTGVGGGSLEIACGRFDRAGAD